MPVQHTQETGNRSATSGEAHDATGRVDETLIEVRNFSRSYSGHPAVRDLDFTVRRGELFGLIGPDGAGKTTTMRTLVTLLRPDSGTLAVAGHDTVRDTREIRSMVGYMPQRFSLYPDLSVEQNLRFFGDLFSVPYGELRARLDRLYRFSRLQPFAERLAGRLSGGMKQKLALSCTLIHNPVLLVLDEPTTGVDPVSRNEFWDILRELKAQGVTILVSTPYMDEAMLCDRIVIMHEGRALAQGTPRELIARLRDPMFSLRDPELVRRFEAIERLSGVRSVQTFGDSLHLTVEAGTDATALEGDIEQAAGRSVTLRPIAPSLEDVFISLIDEDTRHAA